MSKLNPTLKSEPRFATDQLAGGYGALAAKQNAESLLRRAVMACLLWEDLAYESGDSNSENIAALIPLVDPNIVADIAVEARVNQKLRHVPLFIASEMLKHNKHKNYVQEILPKIITRADQLTDFLAIYWKNGRVPIASKAKKGLAKAFYNFNEYKFAKYDRNAAIKLRDVMRLVHPKPRNQTESILFNKIRDRKLTPPDTWEVALSTGKDKKLTWERLITERKLGGLAFLRNLRNMVEAKVDHNIIDDGFNSVYGGMLLPINFLMAANHAPVFRTQIEKMMIKTYANLPKLKGYTVFFIDVSGSMGIWNSSGSGAGRLDNAAAMAILAANQCEDVDIFVTAGNDMSRIHSTEKIKYPEKGFGLINQIKALQSVVGYGGIFTRQALEYAKAETTKKPDRIIIFSDSQDCDHATKRVPKPFGIKNYIVDVSSHSKGINYKGVWDAEISGWSEHFLTYIAATEGLQNTFDDEQSLQ